MTSSFHRILIPCLLFAALWNDAAAQTTVLYQGGAGDGYGRGDHAQQVNTAGPFAGGAGDGYARDGFAQPISSLVLFAGGTGDGYARNGFAQPISSLMPFAGGTGDGYTRSGFAQPISSSLPFGGGSGDGYARSGGTNAVVSIMGLAFLEGPFNTNTLAMNTNLSSAGVVPTVEPYTALGFAQVGGSGGEVATINMVQQSIVDWVRVELREASDPTVLVAARQALLNAFGAIVDPQTADDFIRLNAPPGNYYVVVRHRNHLGAMTATPIAVSNDQTEVNFTSPSTATFGTAAQKNVSGVNVLWAGDVTGDHQLKYTGSGNDRDPILVAVGSTTPNNILTAQYSTRDVNLDGTVKYTGSQNDRDPILVNVGSTTPNNTRTEQVP